MKFKKFLITLLTIAVAYFGTSAVMNRLSRKELAKDPESGLADNEVKQKKDDELLFLLVGVDRNPGTSSTGEFTRTDTIMLFKANYVTGKIDVLSIPRDSRIKIREEFTKANHAHAYGGIGLTLKSLRDFLGLDIDYYAQVDYDGVMKIIDALGGVDYEVPEGFSLDKGSIHIRPGMTHFSGYSAMWYLRTRKTYTNGDIGRVSAQQDFLKAMVDQVVEKASLGDAPKFVQTYIKYVDTNIPMRIIFDMVKNIKNFSSKKFTSYTVPGFEHTMGGVSYYIPDYEKTRKITGKLFKDYKLDGRTKADSSYEEYKNVDYENMIYYGPDMETDTGGGSNYQDTDLETYPQDTGTEYAQPQEEPEYYYEDPLPTYTEPAPAPAPTNGTQTQSPPPVEEDPIPTYDPQPLEPADPPETDNTESGGE